MSHISFNIRHVYADRKQRDVRRKRVNRHRQYEEECRKSPIFALRHMLKILKQLIGYKHELEMLSQPAGSAQCPSISLLDLLEHYLTLLIALKKSHLHYVFSVKEFRSVHMTIKTGIRAIFPFPECDSDEWMSKVMLFEEEKIQTCDLENSSWQIKVLGLRIFYVDKVVFDQPRLSVLSRVDPSTFRGFVRVNRPQMSKSDMLTVDLYGHYVTQNFGSIHDLCAQVAGIEEKQSYKLEYFS